MGYRHGIYVSEVPTSIVPPVRVDAAMPVAFVTAPVHLANDPYSVTNEPRLCHTYSQAVSQLGFSLRPEIWNNYTGPQMLFSQFVLYGISPIVIVNVLDPKIHNEAVTGSTLTLAGLSAVLTAEVVDAESGEITRVPVEGVLIDTVEVQGYEAGTDYTLSFNRDGHIVITAIADASSAIAENATLTINYTKLAPEKVDIYDVIGGYDNQSGRNLGLELMGEIFPRFRMVPGQLLAPKFSADPVVAAVMETKGSNINGHFRCITLCDMPTMIEGPGGELVPHKYTDIPAWKNQNNYVFTQQLNLFPMVRLGSQIYDYSAQMAGLICHTDSENFNIPYNSPSNKNLRANGLCYANGEGVILNTEQVNFLNGQGIVGALNFTNGWVAWGNRTGAFPGNTDVKDAFIPIRRMFNWIGNTIVLTYWRMVDFPLTRRTVDTIIDSINIWLNGLASREFILGGRVEFLAEDNPDTDIIDGIVRFRVRIAPPPPMREAEFILEYDPEYLQVLFAS